MANIPRGVARGCPIAARMRDAASGLCVSEITKADAAATWWHRVRAEGRGDVVETDGKNGAATIALTSGKGGVGKTSLAANLAIALRRQGSRVCLLDADMGLANVNILLGLQPRHTLDDLKAGRVTLDELILPGPDGVDILPAAAGLERLAAGAPQREPELVAAVAALERRYDYLLVDTPAGIGTTTRAFIQPCDLTALVITPEPTSLTDAFTLLRTVLRAGYEGRLAVVVNMLPAQQDGRRLFQRFESAARKYLKVELTYLGDVPMDRGVTQAVVNQRPLLLSSSDSPAARSIEALARRLSRMLPPGSGAGRFTASWAASEPPAQAIGPAVPEPDPTANEAAEIAPVVDTPQEYRGPAGWSLEELADIAESLLASPEVAESAARRFFGRLERRFGERFRRRASDIKTLIYEHLLQDHLAEEQLREIRDVLVETYARRFGGGTASAGHPDVPDVDEVERAIAALYASEHLDQGSARRLVATLSAHHAARFGGPLNPDDARRHRALQALRERFEAHRQDLQTRLTEACLLLEEHARLFEQNPPPPSNDEPEE